MDATFDPRPLFLSALDQLEKLVGRLDPTQLGRPTPCHSYDLRALLGHTLGAIHRIAYIGEGGRGMDVPSPASDREKEGGRGPRHARTRRRTGLGRKSVGHARRPHPQGQDHAGTRQGRGSGVRQGP